MKCPVSSDPCTYDTCEFWPNDCTFARKESQQSPYPVRVAYGWSTDTQAPLSIAIRYFTRKSMSPFGKWAKYSHMYLVFEMSDNSMVVHESLGKTGWRVQKFENLLAWHERSPAHHLYDVAWLPIQMAVVRQIYAESLEWMGTRGYDFKQVLAFALAESIAFRWAGLYIGSNNDQVFCSEGAVELVGKYAPEWDLRLDPKTPYCLVTPQGAYDQYKKLVASAMPCGDT